MANTMNLELAIEAAKDWIAGDPDPATRGELDRLVRARSPELLELMSGTLTFGTAGLRAVVGPGPMRMNRAVVRRTTAAVARYLLEQGTVQPLVVVGADGRLSSADFLEDTIAVLCGYGLRVQYFSEPVATPLVAYAARRLSAQAAIVVTASHNPAKYNGYKLYGGNAVQIVEPVDTEIAEEITRSLPANQERLDARALSGTHPRCHTVAPELLEDYFRDIAALRPNQQQAPARDLRIVYTPLHGVGYAPVARALKEAGFTQVFTVREQQEPNGHFPTVEFPNPEEPGALDRAQQLAREHQADVVIANDPDADRLAVCLPDGLGGFRQLSGNQVGVLLADFLLERAPREPKPLVGQSIVSSPMLERIAAHHHAHCEQTFTGFKWIWTAALDLMAKGKLNYVFGYEEALGYSAGHVVRDKDGISAALLLCELAALEKSRGSSLAERLEGLYRRHGLWVSAQKSITLEGMEGAARIAAAMRGLGAAPPTRVGDQPVRQVRNFEQEDPSRPRWLSTTPLVALDLESGARLLVRPSGTEPKLKIYVDLCQPLGPNDSAAKREAYVLGQAKALAGEMAKLLGLE